MGDPLAIIRALPRAPAPNDDPSTIQGNVTLEQKDLSTRILYYHVANYPGSKVFANNLMGGLKIVEVNMKRRKLGEDDKSEGILEGETIFEIEVTEGMLNRHGTLSGGCAFHILDFCTFSALFVLALVTNDASTGVSTGINLTWHSPALPGTVLRIVSTSVNMEGRTATSRAEVYDKKTKRLLISAVHHVMPLRRHKSGKNYSDSTSKAKL